MFTARRLEKVYEQAKKIDFDDSSKFVFISDSLRITG